VQNIPAGPFHVFAACSGIVISKTVDNSIPDWLMMFDQESLR
jgi:hypothetical protein